MTSEKWHAQVLERAADVAVSAMAIPLRLLDVGCGRGSLLSELVVRVPYADLYVGVDPLPEVLRRARRTADVHINFLRAAAESLPFPDACFDLVVAAFSFAYWADQRAGVAELARVVRGSGKVVLVESTAGHRPDRGRVRKAKEITGLLVDGGLRVERTETLRRAALVRPTVRAFIASP
jgi:ubiquinone/menaquinone biosynthesis C-methylase UbiE